MIRASVCAALLVTGMYAADGRAQTPVPQTVSLRGAILSPICSSEAFAGGDVMGDVNGAFSIAFDCRSDGRISSGTWYLAVTSTAADGTVTELGSIGGIVRSGAFDADSAGTTIVLRGIELAVTQGTGVYAASASGTGTLEATADPSGAAQFLGTLALTF